AKRPPGWSFKEIGGVGVDKNDNVYVFNRGEHPMIVFDCDGNFLRSFGEGMFPRAHGVFMAPDDTIWLTDDGDHTVRQCTLEGKVLLTLGISGKPAPFMSGALFHGCTHPGKSPVCYIGELGAVQPVSRNVPNLGPRVTIVDNTGKRISRLGGLGPGLGPTEFLAPHGLAVDSHGDLYVGEVSWTNWPQTFR